MNQKKTLQDEFAMIVLNSLLLNKEIFCETVAIGTTLNLKPNQAIAAFCYDIANSMIEEKNSRESKFHKNI